MLLPDGLLGGRAFGSQQALQAIERGRHGRVLIAQALEELDHARHRELRAGQPAEGRRRALGLLVAEAEQAVRQFVRLLPICPALHDYLGDTAKVVDQEDPQADGDRPELAEGQRLDLLVGRHQATKAVGVEPTVGVGDVGPRQTKDARIALQRSVRQLGKLPVVVGGQVVPDLAKLLLDDVEVVDQPLRGRGDGALVLDRLGQGTVRPQEDATVVRDPRPDRPTGPGPLRDLLRGGERRPVLLQALHAEQLGDDRFRFVDVTAGLAQDRDEGAP